jgi:hypothetical protein
MKYSTPLAIMVAILAASSPASAQTLSSVFDQVENNLGRIVTLGGLIDGGYTIQAHLTFVLMLVTGLITLLAGVIKLRGGTNEEIFATARDVLLFVMWTMTFFFALVGFWYFWSAIKRAFMGSENEARS